MNIKFGTLNVTLVANPVDLRSGYPKLSAFVWNQLGIDLKRGEDAVVFISKSRETVKVLLADACGGTIVNQRLRAGRFLKFRMSPEGALGLH